MIGRCNGILLVCTVTCTAGHPNGTVQSAAANPKLPRPENITSRLEKELFEEVPHEIFLVYHVQNSLNLDINRWLAPNPLPHQAQLCVAMYNYLVSYYLAPRTQISRPPRLHVGPCMCDKINDRDGARGHVSTRFADYPPSSCQLP